MGGIRAVLAKHWFDPDQKVVGSLAFAGHVLLGAFLSCADGDDHRLWWIGGCLDDT